jgi:OmcA/MtrC family decaheme c-type cytochrome
MFRPYPSLEGICTRKGKTMGEKWITWGPLRLAFLLVVAASLATLAGAEKASFTKKDKAFYLEPKELAFIRPGLQFEIQQASVAADGTVQYRFTLTDAAGQPLDRLGIVTPGAISVRSVAAVIPRNQPNGQTLYTAYTTRAQTSSITNMTEVQASFDAGGVFEKVGEGEYTYTFATKAPSGFDAGATHTIAAWAARDLTEFELGENDASVTFDFVPDGSEVTTTRNIVSDQACNACHGNLGLHDERRTVSLCITCHQPQSTDPDTGNTVDMTTMIHKIHRGADLPSVQAGTPYQIIGFGGSVHDYSTVHYPADVRNCETCHTGVEGSDSTAAALTPRSATATGRHSRQRAALGASPEQVSLPTNYLTKPSRRACGSCHDDVNFATGENHAGLPQISDNQCSNCHIPEGELEFDLSIKGAHTTDRFSKELAGTNFEILGVDNSAPGQNPTVRFSITNDAGQMVAPADMLRLALVMGGSTNGDVSEFVSENATTATAAGGAFAHTFASPIPEHATGTWAVGIEGYQSGTILAGTQQERTGIRDAGENKVFYFPVTDTQAVPRRKVVATEKCNTCHYALDLHGSNRNDVEQCVLCHMPNETDAEVRPEDQFPAESINFKQMIHKIHTGEELQIPFTVYGFRSSVHNYNEVRYPNDRRNCAACHIDGTEQLPLADNLLSAVSPRDYIDPMPPATGACLTCHTGLSAAAHADLSISETLGESCAVCHGQGKEFSVDRSHAQ